MVPEVRLGQRIFGIGMSASSCYFCLDLLYLLVIFPQTIVQLVVSHGLADYIDPLQVLLLALQAYSVIQT